MSLKIYTERCKGCGICAAFCPKKVLAVSELEKIEAVAPENCIQCGQCEGVCPQHLPIIEYLQTVAKHFERE